MLKSKDVYKSCFNSDFKCGLQEVDRIIHYVIETFGPVDECNLYEIKVILNELILNAIKHGSKGDPNKKIRIVAKIGESNEACFDITDEGTGFDLKLYKESHQRADLTSDFLNLKESGRGILLVESLCDEIMYNKKGNKVTVVKKLLKG